MLNSKGGDVVVGVAEKEDFRAAAPRAPWRDSPLVEDKLILGLDIEYDKKGWDSYQRRLTELIESRIGPDVLDQELVELTKLTIRDAEADLSYDICRISIQSSETRQYLNGEHFFTRRGNKTEHLKGPEIDRYWQSR